MPHGAATMRLFVIEFCGEPIQPKGFGRILACASVREGRKRL